MNTAISRSPNACQDTGDLVSPDSKESHRESHATHVEEHAIRPSSVPSLKSGPDQPV